MCNRIREYIVHPAHLAGRIEHQTRVENAEVVTVARPHHRAMLAKTDRAGVSIGRPMPNLEDCHPVPTDAVVRPAGTLP
jgi:hypothetical protein